jgi:hypothetical protein
MKEPAMYIIRVNIPYPEEAADSSRMLGTSCQTMWCHKPEFHNENTVYMFLY